MARYLRSFTTAGIMVLVASMAVAGALPSTAEQAAKQPYAGQQHRALKALSKQEIADYLAGTGMGMAKAAELNGWPGPSHLLEIADKLKLSASSRTKIRVVFTKMKTKATSLGRAIIAAERLLDREFASGRGNASAIVTLIDRIARLKGRLRSVHLLAHIEVRPLLTRHQVALYNQLRGYGAPGGHRGHHRKH